MLYGASGKVVGLGVRHLTFLRWNGAVLNGVGDGPFVFPPSLPDRAPWRFDFELEEAGGQCSIRPTTGVVEAHDVDGVEIECGAQPPRSFDATLKELSFMSPTEAVTLAPPFAASTLAYSVYPTDGGTFLMTNSFSGPSLSATAIANDPGALVMIVGQQVGAGGTQGFMLGPGANQIDIVVTGRDHVTTRLYRVTALVDSPEAGP